jgi:hypothetical protein
MCTNFFFSFVFFLTLNLKKTFSNYKKKSSLSPLSALPHPLALTRPFSLWPLSEARFSPSPSPSQNQKPQETLPSPNQTDVCFFPELVCSSEGKKEKKDDDGLETTWLMPRTFHTIREWENVRDA